MHIPRVSVIIPCYNHGRFIDDAIDSVYEQTFQDHEIIIIDDGSTEPDTLAYFQSFKRPNCKLLRTENGGPAIARNRGISESSAEFILPLDADDRIGPRYLELAVAALDSNPNLGIVYCEAELFGDVAGRWELPPFNFPEVLVSPQIFCASFFRRSDWEKTGGFCNDFKEGWEDYDFWLSILELKREVFQIPETLFYYRKHGNSRSSCITKEMQDLLMSKIVIRHAELYLANYAELKRLYGPGTEK